MSTSKKSTVKVQANTQQVMPDKTPITELTLRDFYAGICMGMLLQDVMKLPSDQRPMMGDITDKAFEMADVAVARRDLTPLSVN